MEKTINYLGKNVKIYQFFSESDNFLNARIDFLRKLEKDNINYKEASKMAKTWQNIKFKNCKYKKKLYDKIKKYDKTI